MKNNKPIERGQTISFRIPSDTPDYIIKELQRLKEKERRNFSSKIAELVKKGVQEGSSKEKETITVPLPKQLTKAQRNWIKHEHSEALLGNIMYQLLEDPVRSTSILAALNSKATDIDEALYLQEEPPEETHKEEKISQEINQSKEKGKEKTDDLEDIDWNKALSHNREADEGESQEPEEDLNDLLGSFLDRMNK
ncbi:hypothetical protein [Saliterribacillus persicus]|uniref:Uncharacterized protein n=1 Tax=Saliterribacillus persicus TaxID=930114 RepID=A0A368Y9N1_9BACI|nr:hypothetical protein [Saliterribacillus persicus]RCW76980.1 hypothetical protein DFR57_102255 [Saliterribacillus persicus]